LNEDSRPLAVLKKLPDGSWKVFRAMGIPEWVATHVQWPYTPHEARSGTRRALAQVPCGCRGRSRAFLTPHAVRRCDAGQQRHDV